MINILHLDNSLSFREVIRDAVTDTGGQYRGTSAGERGLALLREEPVDLIITGTELDDIQATDLVRKLNDSPYRDTPVIVVSASEALELKNSLFGLGVIDFIPKKDITVTTIRQYLEAYREDAELHRVINDLTIAVVDDSRSSLQAIRNIFNLNRITGVSYFGNTADLLNGESVYDVYVLDMILPDISGRELILKLRKRDPNCVIIAVSSLGDYKTISNVLRLGADDYLIKPFNASIFISRLKSSIRTMLLYRELEQARERLKTLSETDGLTGLLNHNTIMSRLEETINSHPTGAVLLFDADNFKAINDTWGHQIGDRVLAAIAGALRDSAGKDTLCGRFGGEEFLLVVPETGPEALPAAITAMLYAVRGIDVGVQDLSVTLSGGAALFDGSPARELLHLADRRLYHAKSTGKNRVFLNDRDVVE